MAAQLSASADIFSTVCDRPRENVPLVGQKIFRDFRGFRITIPVSTFVQNLIGIARLRSEI